MRYRLRLRSQSSQPSCRPLRSLWIISIWLIAASSFVTGCESLGTSSPSSTAVVRVTTTPSGSQEDTTSSTASLAGTFFIWHSWTGSDYEALVTILEQIQQEHPHLILAPQFVEASQLPTQLLNAILAGAGPHLLLAPAAWYPQLQADELIIPFNDVVQEADLSHFVAPALFGLIHDGRLMGLPIWAETVMLYVNTDLMSWSKVPNSTEELLALAKTAELPLLGLYTNLFHLSWGFPAYGSVMFDTEYRVVLDQSAGSAAFLAWLSTAAATPGIDVSRDYENLKQAFLRQELALFVDGPWSLPEFSQALGNALRIRDIPAGPAEEARPWLTAEAVYLVAGQTDLQKQVSARLALLMSEAEETLIATAYRLPAVQKNMNLGSTPVQEFRALLPMAHYMAHRPEMVSVWKHGQEMLQDTVTDTQDPEALVTRFTLLVNEENGK